jgi:PAS domain S-box-containing protein
MRCQVMPDHRVSTLSPGRIALGYAAIAILWIAFSDAVVTHLGLDPAVMTIKGTAFVVVTAALLYFTIRRLVQTLQLALTKRKRAEQEVRNTAAQWQATFDAVQDLVLLLDKDCRILRANHAAAEFLGLPFDKIVGGHCYGFIHGTSTPPAECPLGKMRQSRRHEETEILAREGGPWLSVSADPLFDSSGELTQVVHVARDITARKRAEEALRQSEAYLAEAQRLSHTGSWAFDVASDRYFYASEECARIFEFDGQQDLPSREAIFRLIPPEDWPGVNDAFETTLREKIDTASEFKITLPSGTVKHVHAIRHPILNDAGEVGKLIGTVIDMTERKRAEEKIRHQERELQHLLDFAPQQVAVFGPDRSRLYANRPTLDYFGVTLQEWSSISDPFWFFHPDDRERVAKDVYTGNSSGAPHEFEGRLRRKDGVYRWFLFRDNPMRDEYGHIMRWYISGTDIEDWKQAQQALQESEANLNRAQEIAHIGSWHLDLARNQLTWSNEVYRLFNTSIGTPLDYEAFLGMIHPEDRERVDRAWAAALKGAPYDIEHRILVGDGLKWVRERAVVEFGPTGKAVKGTGTVQDVTERKGVEEERRESAERFRAIADYTYDWESWVGNDGALLWLNPAVERITGYSVDECMVMPGFPIPIIAEADRERVARQIGEAVRGSSRNDFEFRVRHKDGRLVWVAASWQPIYDARGARLGHRSSIRDIGERKKTEEALRRSETYLAEAQRLSHTGSWAWDVARNIFTFSSEENCRIYGVDKQEDLETEGVLRVVHPEDRERVKNSRERSLREKVDTCDEFRIILPDGTIKHIHAIRHPILNDAGEVVELVGTSVDITDRKRAEDALRESETRFRTFVDHAADAFFMLDVEQGIIIDVNRPACESLGYTREELIGMQPMTFHLDSDRAQMKATAEQAAAGETVVDIHWHRRKDGALSPVEVHTSLVSYGGRRFLLKVARDITDRVRAEEQHDRLRQLEAELAHINRVSMLGELAASIAHELGQPLSGVVSNGSACLRWLAREEPNLEEAQEAARRIVRDGKRAGEVIARIRALTKRTTVPRERLDLNDTLRDVLVLVADEAKRNAVSIHTQFDAPAPVGGDRVQLQQVALNLVINAIEAMTSVEGRPRELMIVTRNLDPDQVQVTVEDSGTGLNPTTIDKIFDPFYTTKPTGMGMGLSICRSIVQAHEGRLWAETKDAPGARFHFTLPISHEAESHA